MASLGMSASLRPSWYATQLTSMPATLPACARFHRHRAFRVARPELRAAQLFVGHAARPEIRGVVERPQRAERVSAKHGVGAAAAEEVHEEGRDERPVHDE